MTNADRFKQVFGLFATEVWAFSEKDFLNWLNEEPPELTVKAMTKCNKCVNWNPDTEDCKREQFYNDCASAIAYALQKKRGIDGCEGCAFEDRKKWEGPCWRCKRNCKDYWRRRDEKE